MKILLENMPEPLRRYREPLRQCIQAFATVKPVRKVYLFGSYARGNALPDSDVDLCIVAEGAEHQLETARQFRHAIWDIWPRPSLTLIPIAPQRLEEKKACRDHFFGTILKEGVLLAEEN